MNKTLPLTILRSFIVYSLYWWNDSVRYFSGRLLWSLEGFQVGWLTGVWKTRTCDVHVRMPRTYSFGPRQRKWWQQAARKMRVWRIILVRTVLPDLLRTSWALIFVQQTRWVVIAASRSFYSGGFMTDGEKLKVDMTGLITRGKKKMRKISKGEN